MFIEQIPKLNFLMYKMEETIVSTSWVYKGLRVSSYKILRWYKCIINAQTKLANINYVKYNYFSYH